MNKEEIFSRLTRYGLDSGTAEELAKTLVPIKSLTLAELRNAASVYRSWGKDKLQEYLKEVVNRN